MDADDLTPERHVWHIDVDMTDDELDSLTEGVLDAIFGPDSDDETVLL